MPAAPANPRIAAAREALARAVAGLDGVALRKVLASEAWFARGSLFALVSRDARVVVRLPDESAQDELLAVAGARPWKIGAKAPMRAWIELPEEMNGDRKTLAKWVKRGWELAPTAKTNRKRAT
jgi:TfoX/Sxy family transcriptional regulator of competence genes